MENKEMAVQEKGFKEGSEKIIPQLVLRQSYLLFAGAHADVRLYVRHASDY